MIFSMKSFYPLIAAALVILANHILGSWKSVIEGQFDWRVCKLGLIKALGVFFSIVLIEGAGYLMPDLAIVSLNGEMVTILTAVNIIATSAIAYYGALDVQKIVEILKVPVTKDLGPIDYE